MAKFKSHGIESISMSLSVLSNLPDEAAYNVLEAGAAVLIEKWKEKLLPMKRTGQLIESIKAKRKTGSNGLPVDDGTTRWGEVCMMRLPSNKRYANLTKNG